jgi:hypothetical protein
LYLAKRFFGLSNDSKVTKIKKSDAFFQIVLRFVITVGLCMAKIAEYLAVAGTVMTGVSQATLSEECG